MDKYGSPEMRRVFDEENKLRLWLNVEAAVAETQASLGIIPRSAADEIEKNANTKTVTLTRTKEIEKVIHHDLMSMVRALTEACSGDGRKYVHFGLTSSDVEDTAIGLQVKDALDLIETRLGDLRRTLSTVMRKSRRLSKHKESSPKPHGPDTLGLRVANWLSGLSRYEQRLSQVRERIVVGKILGIVGTGAGLGKNALEIQEQTLRSLGLKSAGLVTQVIPRDNHAETLLCIALLGSFLEKIVSEIFNIRNNEVLTVIGDSSRRNMILRYDVGFENKDEKNERVSGLARLLRGITVPALENVPLWHERDLSNSANERFLFPMSFILLDEMFRITKDVLLVSA